MKLFKISTSERDKLLKNIEILDDIAQEQESIMTDIKLEVGKQYKARGGWRCFVLKYYEDDTFLVWHDSSYSIEDDIIFHDQNGKHCSSDITDERCIIAEWSEPKTHEVWIGLSNYHHNNGVTVVSSSWIFDKPYNKTNLLALKKFPITEGEYDE